MFYHLYFIDYVMLYQSHLFDVKVGFLYPESITQFSINFAEFTYQDLYFRVLLCYHQ